MTFRSLSWKVRKGGGLSYFGVASPVISSAKRGDRQATLRTEGNRSGGSGDAPGTCWVGLIDPSLRMWRLRLRKLWDSLGVAPSQAPSDTKLMLFP